MKKILCTLILLINIDSYSMQLTKSKNTKIEPITYRRTSDPLPIDRPRTFTITELDDLKSLWFKQWCQEYSFKDAGKKTLLYFVGGISGYFFGCIADKNSMIEMSKYCLLISAAYLFRAISHYKKLRPIDSALNKKNIDFFYSKS